MGKTIQNPSLTNDAPKPFGKKNKAFNEWLSRRTDSKRIAFSKSRNQCNKIIDETNKPLDEIHVISNGYQ